jgi:hypothetical protein
MHSKGNKMNKLTLGENISSYKGEIEIIIRDRNGNVVNRITQPNQVKIFAKEMLAHRIPSSNVWDPDANSGAGGWVASNIDPNDEFSARYILFGGAFSATGMPIDNDPRYYTIDPITQAAVPIRLSPGADYGGELINAIPLAEPMRPLKKIESITYTPTYQPACSPLVEIQAGSNDVRAINNIVTLSTVLRSDEYNGFGVSNSDFFTITEVALAGGRTIGNIDACDCTPRELFLEGEGGTNTSPISGQIQASGGGDIISLTGSIDIIKVGDQVKLVGAGGTVSDSFNQLNPYYLVLQKSVGGGEIQLDRVPTDINGDVITGDIGLYRDTLRLFSHRILEVPFRKSASFEIEVSWRLIFN